MTKTVISSIPGGRLGLARVACGAYTASSPIRMAISIPHPYEMDGFRNIHLARAPTRTFWWVNLGEQPANRIVGEQCAGPRSGMAANGSRIRRSAGAFLLV